MIRSVCFTVAFVAIHLSGLSALAQSTRLGESCDLSVVGAKDTAGFLAFDRELHSAVARPDAGAVIGLVDFPLRVNTGHGSISINDPAALQARFAEIFPQSIRSAILDQKPAGIFCNSSGVMYGNGAIWVNPARYGFAIEVINLSAGAEARPRTEPEVEFVCRTDKHRVLIDVNAAGVPRYRAWNRPHELTEKPDLEISAGKKDYEGTGACSSPIYSFKSGAATFTVEGAGCAPAPKGAHGQLSVSVNGKQQLEAWCY